MTIPTTVPTVGSIADQLGVPVHRVRYVIESRGIEPSGRAGNARVFSDADVDRIASELRRIERERERAIMLPESKPTQSAPPLLVPEREAARLLGGLSIKTMFNLRQRGLPFTKIGSRTMYCPADLARWVEQQKTPNAVPRKVKTVHEDR